MHALLATAAVHTVPHTISMKAAREEAEMVMFESVREVLAACKLKPRQACNPAPLLLLHPSLDLLQLRSRMGIWLRRGVHACKDVGRATKQAAG